MRPLRPQGGSRPGFAINSSFIVRLLRRPYFILGGDRMKKGIKVLDKGMTKKEIAESTVCCANQMAKQAGGKCKA